MSTHLTRRKTKAHSFIRQLDWQNTAAEGTHRKFQDFGKNHSSYITCCVSLLILTEAKDVEQDDKDAWHSELQMEANKHSRISGQLIFSTRVCKTDKHTLSGIRLRNARL